MKKNVYVYLVLILLASFNSNAELKIDPEANSIPDSKIEIRTPVDTVQFENKKFDNVVVVHATGLLEIKNTLNTQNTKLDILNKVSKGDCDIEYRIENRTLFVTTEKKIFVIKNNCSQDLNLYLPENKKLNISLGMGVIIAKGVFPSLDVNLGSGEVNIQGKISKLNLDVASGAVNVSGLDGYGKITLLSGDLDIKYDKEIVGKFNQLHVSKSVGNTRIQIPKGAKTESKLKTLLGKIYDHTTASHTGKFYFSVQTNVGDITMDTY